MQSRNAVYRKIQTHGLCPVREIVPGASLERPAQHYWCPAFGVILPPFWQFEPDFRE
jgi:hypothetical protein